MKPIHDSEAIARAYTRIADHYDGSVEGDAWMRQILWDRYLTLFRPGQHVLDVGCGTGLDALFLARQGIRVTGIDISPGMIARLQAKAQQENLTDRVKTMTLAHSELSALLPKRFDGIYSAFAGLNTTPTLDGFAVDAARLLHPNGRLIIHVLNRFSLWEWLTLIRRGRLAEAAGLRRQSERLFMIGGQPVRHYMSFPRQTYRRSFAAYFTLDACYGLGCLIPPHDMTWIPARVIKTLGALEQRVRSWRPFVQCGRFFTLEMTRRTDG